MKLRNGLSLAAATLVVAALALASAAPAAANHSRISGNVTDASNGQVLADVCVTLGPPITCYTHTDGNGFYLIDLAALAAPDGLQWDMYFLKQGYPTAYSGKFVVNGPVVFDQKLGTPPVPCAPARAGAPTATVYLPNITKTLGGPDGWQTPFIVQNVGGASTEIEVSFYRFDNGACVARLFRAGLGPGTSQAYSPNHLDILPGNTQFSVVIRTFGAKVVSVVNEHQNPQSETRAEALSYDGASSGSTTVSLPNIVRRFNGFVTPFIIQNLGTVTTTATARFVSFDGTVPPLTVTRVIESGRSKFVDPNSDDPALGAPGLVDGKQYAVTVTAGQPVSVVVNTHFDAAWVTEPVAYATNGLTGGAPTLYGPYAAKNTDGIGRVSTIVVQNLSSASVTPALTFTPLGGGAPQSFSSSGPIGPGASWAFDPRFASGTTTPCSGASPSCLGNGEYSFVASAGGNIAAVVNVISSATAMGYAATPSPATRYFLPNVTRTLGGASGWTTPILLQAVSASGATLRWYRFSDGALVHTQTLTMPTGSGVRVDPRSLSELSDDTQYAVVIEGAGGTVSAVVVELASGGDNAMIYEGFPSQ